MSFTTAKRWANLWAGHAAEIGTGIAAAEIGTETGGGHAPVIEGKSLHARHGHSQGAVVPERQNSINSRDIIHWKNKGLRELKQPAPVMQEGPEGAQALEVPRQR